MPRNISKPQRRDDELPRGPGEVAEPAVMPDRQMQTMKCFLCFLLLPAFAFGGIWPDNFGAFHRTAVMPPGVSDRPLWDEYGFQQAEQAEYESGARKFTASAYRLQDSTGALAAFEWQRPAEAKPSKVSKLAVETPESLMLAHGNY